MDSRFHFVHVRRNIENGKDPRGGLSIAWRWLDPENVEFSYARCNEYINYSKQAARAITINRLRVREDRHELATTDWNDERFDTPEGEKLKRRLLRKLRAVSLRRRAKFVGQVSARTYREAIRKIWLELSTFEMVTIGLKMDMIEEKKYAWIDYFDRAIEAVRDPIVE